MPRKPRTEPPSGLVDAWIAALPGWRREALARIRRLVREADPDIVEEVKWRKPSNPGGVPVWSHDGIVGTAGSLQHTVRFTFAEGATLPDPAGLFNATLEANHMRAIDLREGDEIDERAFVALVRAAVTANARARAARTAKKR